KKIIKKTEKYLATAKLLLYNKQVRDFSRAITVCAVRQERVGRTAPHEVARGHGWVIPAVERVTESSPTIVQGEQKPVWRY
ncbi:MAG: hypothetical protein LBG50_04170, partial [Clostridiales Family XIII bacterium]|nr:hypothetical protein [Clostridiales Family XIII bacterium]